MKTIVKSTAWCLEKIPLSCKESQLGLEKNEVSIQLDLGSHITLPINSKVLPQSETSFLELKISTDLED